MQGGLSPNAMLEGYRLAVLQKQRATQSVERMVGKRFLEEERQLA